MTIPGIGPIISTSIVSAIGSGEAIERGRDFGAWLGLVPRQYSTGGKPILGKISKTGNIHIRTFLVQAAHVLLMRPHNWHKSSFGNWLEKASQHLHKNKLAAALANKLARIAWSVLYHEKEFDKDKIRMEAIQPETIYTLSRKETAGTNERMHPKASVPKWSIKRPVC